MSDLMSVILACSIGVHPQTVQAIIKHESGGNPYAINNQVRSFYPTRLDDAQRIAVEQVRAGRSTDIGLMQINSSHLPKLASLGISESDLLEPCTNIKVGAWLLADSFARRGVSWDAVGAYNAACTQLKGDDCAAARSRYAWRVYRRLPGEQAKSRSQQAAPASRTPPASPAPAPFILSTRVAR